MFKKPITPELKVEILKYFIGKNYSLYDTNTKSFRNSFIKQFSKKFIQKELVDTCNMLVTKAIVEENKRIFNISLYCGNGINSDTKINMIITCTINRANISIEYIKSEIFTREEWKKLI